MRLSARGHAVRPSLCAMTTEKLCQRNGCSKLVQPPFKKYCSDACRDTAQRAVLKRRAAHAAGAGVAKRLYRMYDYRNT
jgi:hypothetical protein